MNTIALLVVGFAFGAVVVGCAFVYLVGCNRIRAAIAKATGDSK